MNKSIVPTPNKIEASVKLDTPSCDECVVCRDNVFTSQNPIGFFGFVQTSSVLRQVLLNKTFSLNPDLKNYFVVVCDTVNVYVNHNIASAIVNTLTEGFIVCSLVRFDTKNYF